MADTYAYEEAEEKKAMLRNLHAPIKKWYLHANCRSILVYTYFRNYSEIFYFNAIIYFRKSMDNFRNFGRI